MITNEGSRTIRENELPQLRPKDTKFAQTGASCSVNWCRYSASGESGRRGCTGGCSGRRIPEKEILFRKYVLYARRRGNLEKISHFLGGGEGGGGGGLGGFGRGLGIGG